MLCGTCCLGLALDEYDEYFHTDCMIGETDYTQPLLDYKQDGTLRESLALISCNIPTPPRARARTHTRSRLHSAHGALCAAS